MPGLARVTTGVVASPTMTGAVPGRRILPPIGHGEVPDKSSRPSIGECLRGVSPLDGDTLRASAP